MSPDGRTLVLAVMRLSQQKWEYKLPATLMTKRAIWWRRWNMGSLRSEPQGAHRKSQIHTVIYNDFGPIAPDIVEQVHHNPDSLVPH
jgi:hypothetical protein